MIPNGDRWHYLAVKKLSALLKGIKSKHKGDFYCLNWLHLYKWVCENKDFCKVVLSSEDTKILEFAQ